MNNKYIFLLILLLFSCRENEVVIDSEEKRVFVESNQVGYHKGGRGVLLYDKEKHQIVVNSKRHLFRLQSDGQEEYINVTLEKMPRSKGDHIVIYFNVFSTEDNISYTHRFECSKMSNDKIWFWNVESKEGIIMPIL